MLKSIPSRVAVVLVALIFLVSSVGASQAVAQSTVSSPEVVVSGDPRLPATVTDVNGDAVDVADVSRIVPLNGNVAETIFALGLGNNVVAVDTSALYPPEALSLPKIGYQRELSAEGILSFEPTLVIGTENAGPPEVLQQVRDAGVTVVILSAETSTAGAVEQIRQIGAAVGLPEAGNTLADQVDSRFTGARELIGGVEAQPRVAFLYIRGEGTQLIAGANTQADTVIAAAGGINVGTEIGIDGYQPITPEALVEAAPDVFLVMQAGLASVGGVDGLMTIPGIAQTPAGESGTILAFEDLYLLGFGPRLGDAVYDLTLALHPEIEGEPLHPEWQGTDLAMPDASPAASPES